MRHVFKRLLQAPCGKSYTGSSELKIYAAHPNTLVSFASTGSIRIVCRMATADVQNASGHRTKEISQYGCVRFELGRQRQERKQNMIVHSIMTDHPCQSGKQDVRSERDESTPQRGQVCRGAARIFLVALILRILFLRYLLSMCFTFPLCCSSSALISSPYQRRNAPLYEELGGSSSASSCDEDQAQRM